MMPIARSSTLPFRANSLNSFSMASPPFGGGTRCRRKRSLLLAAWRKSNARAAGDLCIRPAAALGSGRRKGLASWSIGWIAVLVGDRLYRRAFRRGLVRRPPGGARPAEGAARFSMRSRISVYCTSWTFFGSVGVASRSGLDFLPIYIGPILLFTLGYPVLRRVIRLSKAERITSVADFMGARYGKNQPVAVVTTLIAVTAALPYIALQLKAISASRRDDGAGRQRHRHASRSSATSRSSSPPRSRSSPSSSARATPTPPSTRTAWCWRSRWRRW